MNGIVYFYFSVTLLPHILSLRLPEAVVQGVSVGVAPVLHVNAEAVVALAGQQVELLVPQPVFPLRLTEAIAVFRPAAVEIHRAVMPPLEHRPTAT